MRSFKFATLFISFLFISACTTVSGTSKKNLTLSKVESVKWSDVSRSDVESLFGKPDIRDFTEEMKLEEAWIYLDSSGQATRLSLIFNASTGKLLSANWFFLGDESNTLDVLVKRYPQMKFELNSFEEERSLRAPKMLFYSSSSTGGPEIAVFERSNKVSSISWSLAPGIVPEKRSPTSH